MKQKRKKNVLWPNFLQLFRVHKVVPNIPYLNIPLYIVSIIEAKLLFTYLLLKFMFNEFVHIDTYKIKTYFFSFQFVAHPNVQQLLASIWYEGLPGFRQLNMVLQFLEVCRIGLLFPFFSICYIVCPWASFSQKLRKPFIKFICSSSSYFTFLCKYFH